MGLETVCTVTVNGSAAEAKALLEAGELIVRAPMRLKVPFDGMISVEARDGELVIRHAGGQVSLALGPKAKTWADKITNPRGLLDKLGVKKGMKVGIVNIDDGGFLGQLEERVPSLRECSAGAEFDLVFYGVEEREGLEWLESFRKAIKPSGAIWVVSRKGSTEVREMDVRKAAREADLVDVKVAAFSETHTAAKLMIPRAAR